MIKTGHTQASYNVKIISFCCVQHKQVCQFSGKHITLDEEIVLYPQSLSGLRITADVF